MGEKVIPKTKVLNEIRADLDRFQSNYDPEVVLRQVEAKLNSLASNLQEEPWEAPIGDPLFKALSLSEFKNGSLMVTIIPEQYKTFGIDLLRKLQEEYNSTTPSEQATIELVVLSFIRSLELQRRINGYINDQLTKTDILYFAILSKELDRASRQYLSALQALRMLKQPSLNVNIKTNTAIVGQNQIIQENKNVNPI